MDAATASEFQNFIAEPEEDVSRKEKINDGRAFSLVRRLGRRRQCERSIW